MLNNRCVLLCVVILFGCGGGGGGGGGSPAGATADVGPSGGDLQATGADGTVYHLSIPPGAIGSVTKVTLVPETSLLHDPELGALAPGVTLLPDGLALAADAELSITLPADPPATELPAIFHRGADDPGVLLETTAAGRTLTAMVSHFSSATPVAPTGQQLVTQWGTIVLQIQTLGLRLVDVESLVSLYFQVHGDPAAYPAIDLGEWEGELRHQVSDLILLGSLRCASSTTSTGESILLRAENIASLMLFTDLEDEAVYELSLCGTPASSGAQTAVVSYPGLARASARLEVTGSLHVTEPIGSIRVILGNPTGMRPATGSEIHCNVSGGDQSEQWPTNGLPQVDLDGGCAITGGLAYGGGQAVTVTANLDTWGGALGGPPDTEGRGSCSVGGGGTTDPRFYLFIHNYRATPINLKVSWSFTATVTGTAAGDLSTRWSYAYAYAMLSNVYGNMGGSGLPYACGAPWSLFGEADLPDKTLALSYFGDAPTSHVATVSDQKTISIAPGRHLARVDLWMNASAGYDTAYGGADGSVGTILNGTVKFDLVEP